ncbi:MAG: hypothetical protein ACM31O_17400 [Bacteroidota bacterium]
MGLLTKLRDKVRGYTDDDVAELRTKVGEAHPGEVIALTRADIRAFGDLCVRSINVRDGGIDMVAEHPMVFLMADSLAKFIGDYNYVEMRMTHRRTGESYIMHCQKQSGETPYEQKARAERERDEWKARWQEAVEDASQARLERDRALSGREAT